MELPSASLEVLQVSRAPGDQAEGILRAVPSDSLLMHVGARVRAACSLLSELKL